MSAYRVTLLRDDALAVSSDESLSKVVNEWWAGNRSGPLMFNGGLVEVEDRRERPDVMARLDAIEQQLAEIRAAVVHD